MTRRPTRARRPTQTRSLKRFALAAVAILIAGIVGGPELATRVRDAIDGATGQPGRETPAPSASGGNVTGTVTRVTDGDTFTVGSQRVRICGINTPERGEQGGAHPVLTGQGA